jgi:pimeloyl-ACP methyl ester carboxylesterase
VACGALLGDRVRRVALASPSSPADAPEHGFVPRDPVALRERGETFARLLRDDPAGFYAFLLPDFSEADRRRKLALDADQRNGEIENFREAFRQGVDAYVEDHLLVAGDWGDLLPRLTRPTRIWQGVDDNNTPPASAHWMAERIPGVELTLVQGGHSLTDDAWPEILSWVTAGTA